MKEFKGRVINGGYYKGEAVVSRQGVNTLATFQSAALAKAGKVVVADQNNPDIYQQNITGKALCLPQTIGSTTGGMVIQVICSMGINPACMLFSEHIDSLAGAGVILSVVWEKSPLIAIDQLGQDFLDSVHTGDIIEVTPEGLVRIL